MLYVRSKLLTEADKVSHMIWFLSLYWVSVFDILYLHIACYVPFIS